MKNKLELALRLMQYNKPAQLVRHCSIGDGIVHDIAMLVFIKVVDLESRVFKTPLRYSSRSLS